MSNKTIIACRPGMQQAMQSAFAGIEVIVDDTLDKDYEFRERAMSLDELLEEEISKEERQEADPKNALTLIVPLVQRHDSIGENTHSLPYLCLRLAPKTSPGEVRNILKGIEPTLTGTFPDYEINVAATIGEIKAALKKADVEVYSISESAGLELLAETF